jgi:hypothetical protein
MMSISWGAFRELILERYKDKPDTYSLSLGHWEGEGIGRNFCASYRVDIGQFRRNEYSGTGAYADGPPSEDPTVTYLKLSIKLHILIAEGKGDDQEADDIRDKMDAPWQDFTPDEVKLTDSALADLNLIHDAYEERMK